MNVSFIKDGHRITLERNVFDMKMTIDGNCCDMVKGIFKKDNDAILRGSYINAQGETEEIVISYKCGGLESVYGTATLIAGNTILDEKRIL